MNNSETINCFDGTEIAIIGMSGRFPGARNLQEYWQNLLNGVESIRFFSEEELEPSGLDPVAMNSPNYVKAAPTLEGIEMFDADFFGYTPREAEVMDPQHRIFLECAWEALENAGYNPLNYDGAIGIYGGARTSSYLFNLYSNANLVNSVNSFQIGLGNDLAFLTTRVAYKLNLKGPACSVHTACSTSLVAVHLACQALLINECSLALAGGVAVNVPHRTGYLYQQEGILSPDGHCRVFDAKARGTIFGSGAGIVALKRLEEAIEDGDTIHAVIKGSAINNDGAAKASFTAPSVRSQTELILEAFANAGIEADTLSYIEAHGTGTPLGDPIEVQALTKAYRTYTEKKGFCAIGSVKTNVGHLDAAAGVAGLIKTVLSLKHRQLPPTLHFQEPNPNIDFAGSPFYVNDSLKPWPAADRPRRAGVSSFGVGGTNAHLILEQAPELEPSSASRPWQALCLSAHTATALQAASARLASRLREDPDLCLADVAYTLAVGRRAFAHRRVVICRSAAEACALLEEPRGPWALTHTANESSPEVIYLLAGQGAQSMGMCRELYRDEVVFRQVVDQCSQEMARDLELDLRQVLYPEAGDESWASERLKEPAVTQVAMLTTQYALSRLWEHWGVRAGGILGHSLGELVGVCLSGGLSLPEAMRLVAERGRLMSRTGPGGMAAVLLGEQELERMLEEIGGVEIAAVNGRRQCVVSGELEELERCETELKRRGVAVRRLETGHGFHSSQMGEVLPEYEAALRRVSFGEPQMRLMSNLSGKWLKVEEATDPQYWVRQMRERVRFADGVREVNEGGEVVYLELGGKEVLGRLVLGEVKGAAVVKTLSGGGEEGREMARAVGELWARGVEVDWGAYYGGERRRRVELPSYPFERQRCWIESGGQNALRQVSADKREIADWFYLPVWRKGLTPKPNEDWLSETEGVWLVFEDDAGVGAEIGRRMKEEGKKVVKVIRGKEFARLTEDSYRVRAAVKEDYRRLIEMVAEIGRIKGTVHLWALKRQEDKYKGGELFERAQEEGYYSLLYLSQELVRQRGKENVILKAVANRREAVRAGDCVNAEKATTGGVLKVLGQEAPWILSQSIDVELPKSPVRNDERLIEQLMEEIRSTENEAEVAFRWNQRYVKRYEAIRMEKETGERRRLKDRGVYLITGGTGRIGLRLAKRLANQVNARLVLISRKRYPNREDWERLESGDGKTDENVKELMRQIRQIEEAGAEVLLAQADVCLEAEMKEAISMAENRFGPINGVIHAAGVTHGSSVFRPITEIGEAETAAQFAPKAHGLLILEKLFSGKRLDFCLLMSSNAAVLGGLGLAAYSAANLFMDAFVSDNRMTNKLPWISANWDHWFAEEEARIQTNLSQYTMGDEASLEAFDRVVNSAPLGQIVVSTSDLPARLRMWIGRESSTRAPITQTSNSDSAARQSIQSQRPYDPPTNDRERRIVEIWQEILGIETVGIRDSFFELGGHSLLATVVVTRLRETFNVELPLRAFFEFPTVEGLAGAVALAQAEEDDRDQAEILEVLERLSEEEAEAELQKKMWSVP